MNKAIIGFVEHFEPFSIDGWALRHDGKPLVLKLRVNAQVYDLNVAWIEREDVAKQHGAQFLTSGFRCTLSNQAILAVKIALLRRDAIEVIADDVPLQNLAEMPAPESVPKSEALMLGQQLDDRRAVVESWGHFIIFGWALVDGHAPASYTLRCNGMDFSCLASRYERPDVADALGMQVEMPGFAIELPGYLWETVPGNAEANLELYAGEKALSAEPLILSRATAGRWVSEICRMYKGQEKQYLLLHALEHVHYGRLEPYLDEETLDYLRDFAGRMKLSDLVSDESRGGGGGRQLAPAASATQVLLERALRSLNEIMVGSTEPLLANVRRVLREHQIVGEPRERFLMAVVPMLCRQGNLSELGELLNFARLKQLETEPGLWEMSLAPPAFVLEGDVRQAAEIFSRMSRRLDHGWLNTECVRFTVIETLRLEATGAIEPKVAENLRNSFVGLLDGFNGEWFSRLHDLGLVDAMVDILANLGNYTDPHRKQMVSAAIRIYGLSPTLWERISDRDISLTTELRHARTAWNSLAEALADSGRPIALRSPMILKAIGYFMQHNAREAVIVLREVVANGLGDPGFTSAYAGLQLVENLVSQDKAESFRVAAAPFDREADKGNWPGSILGGLRETLRLSSEYASSPMFGLQEEAARLLSRLSRFSEKRDNISLSSLIEKLRVKALILSTDSARYLGGDVLAQTYRLARQAQLPEQNSLLMELGQVVQKSIASLPSNASLEQPVQTALSHVSNLPPDPLLAGFLQEARTLLRQKFGGKYEALFAQSGGGQPSRQGVQGWPSDTLVIIYSCRAYLNSRVEAIRKTWLKDLVDRGIPYLIVVGDGDGAVHGDILELAVSDRYEDLPKKTLALLKWVDQNADAQFLLKIDDDCYLDVGRYVDSLSYRKYPYYGQVVGCTEGRMDRRWHMAKSHDPYSKKSLDKSPEPSVYAKGGGGYCLSRSAIGKALEMANTDAGRRLLSCSFMEDKYIGDLLTLAGIKPANEDYEFYYRFRGAKDGVPVGMWENSFFPSAATPTKVVHLDREHDQEWVHKNAASDELWPKKIWPTYKKPSIAFKSNQLELLTDTGKLGRLLSKKLFVVSVVRNERTMLPHFLAHYRALGVEAFIFVDNCSTDGTVEFLHAQADVVLYSSDTEYKHSHYGVCWQQAVMGNHCLGKWVVLADADEFLVYENCERMPLSRFVEGVESDGSNGLMLHMIDMYPYGDLGEASFSQANPFKAAPFFDGDAQIELVYGGGHFSNSRNFVNGLRHRLAPSRINAYVSQKYAVFRYLPWLRFSEGIHYAANMKVSSRQAYIAHFKYHSEFKSKVIEEVRRRQHFNNAEEYQKYLAMLSESAGGFGVAEKSVKYKDSHSFLEAFSHFNGKGRLAAFHNHRGEASK